LKGYALVGISRGGLVPLRLISDHLSAKEVSTLGVRFYEDIGKTRDAPEVFFPVQGDVAGKSVVLIDDISDTGQSLIAARKHLREKGAVNIIVATILKKPHTRLVPDIFVSETAAWVIFPWEVQETIGQIVGSSVDRDTALAELSKAGLKEEEYDRALKSRFGGTSN